MSKVTIKDIARQLQVSATTFSSALNGKPGVDKAVYETGFKKERAEHSAHVGYDKRNG